MDKYRKTEVIRPRTILTASFVPTDPIFCLAYDNMTLLLDYTRGKAGGAVSWYIEYRTEDDGEWHRNTIYDAGVVAVNNDTESSVQREQFEYGATSKDREQIVFGPLSIVQFAKHVRFAFAETGESADPGTCRAQLVLTRNKQPM